MVLIPDPRTSPDVLTVDTVRAWLLELTEVEQRIGPRCARWDALCGMPQRCGTICGALMDKIWQHADPEAFAILIPQVDQLKTGATPGMAPSIPTVPTMTAPRRRDRDTAL